MIKTDKVVYRTRTLEEYDWLMEKLEEAGCRWVDGALPTKTKDNNWLWCLGDTCVECKDKMMTFADSDHFDGFEDEYEFIEVSDLMGDDEEETDAQDKTEKETDAIEELEAIHKQVTSQINDLRKQGKEPKAIEYTIKVCFE